MKFRGLTAVLLCAALVFALTACASSRANYEKKKDTSDKTGANLTASPVSRPDYADLKAEAEKLNSTPGRVALAEIICKLDDSNVISELAPQSAADLLKVLQETALQKSETLETIDSTYNLKSILASEGIYVDIKSNALTTTASAANKSASDDWISGFQKAISQ